jgi:hypothetical protein
MQDTFEDGFDEYEAAHEVDNDPVHSSGWADEMISAWNQARNDKEHRPKEAPKFMTAIVAGRIEEFEESVKKSVIQQALAIQAAADIENSRNTDLFFEQPYLRTPEGIEQTNRYLEEMGSNVRLEGTFKTERRIRSASGGQGGIQDAYLETTTKLTEMRLRNVNTDRVILTCDFGMWKPLREKSHNNDK